MNMQRGLAHRANQLLELLDEIGPRTPVPPPLLARTMAQVGVDSSRFHPPTATITENPPVTPLPRQLTTDARRLLLNGRRLLDQLQSLTASIPHDDHCPTSTAYRQTIALTEVAVRTVTSFPDDFEEQAGLTVGLAAIFNEVSLRVARLRAWSERRQAEEQRLETLADWLSGLVNNRPVLWKPIEDLADAIWRETHAETPLRFMQGLPERPEQWAAAHALNVATVMARLARVGRTCDHQSRPIESIIAALVFDAGMAALPSAILTETGPLNPDQRRQMESHVGLSAEAIKRIRPADGWLIDAVLAHHERSDGSGYPSGNRGAQIPKLARLLAVCDVYAALSCARSHRPALAPRAALTETLLEADRGRLDPELTELLLELSFYPVGTAVELSDGRIGIVVSTHWTNGDLTLPVKPIVQLLLDEHDGPLAWPETINLAASEGRSIVRSLSAEEQKAVLGPLFWYLM